VVGIGGKNEMYSRIETLASGVPVIQTNQGAFPELLDLTDGGILYESNEFFL
jgi:glycosyltransferase involved in cell wall biosynthesis